jgi:hypothetical protein
LPVAKSVKNLFIPKSSRISLLANISSNVAWGNEMAEWWTTNWRNIIGVTGTVMAAIGVYLSFKGWKRKRPTYVIRSNNIFCGLEHTVPDVEVKFAGYGFSMP